MVEIVGGRFPGLLIELAVGAVAVATALLLLGLWWDERFVRAFQEQEQVAIRPESCFPSEARTGDRADAV
jgi:hypothetical protein